MLSSYMHSAVNHEQHKLFGGWGGALHVVLDNDCKIRQAGKTASAFLSHMSCKPAAGASVL